LGAPFAFLGGRFSKNEGQGNAQLITTDSNMGLTDRSPHPLSCGMGSQEFKVFVFEISFEVLFVCLLLFLTALGQNSV
jgi:hypothetical protein